MILDINHVFIVFMINDRMTHALIDFHGLL